MGALELGDEQAELLLGPEVVVSLPGPAQPPTHRGAVALGQVLEHVSLLVAHAALDGRRVAEHVADRLAKRLGAVEHAEHALGGVEATIDEVGEQRGGHRGVLG